MRKTYQDPVGTFLRSILVRLFILTDCASFFYTVKFPFTPTYAEFVFRFLISLSLRRYIIVNNAFLWVTFIAGSSSWVVRLPFSFLWQYTPFGSRVYVRNDSFRIFFVALNCLDIHSGGLCLRFFKISPRIYLLVFDSFTLYPACGWVGTYYPNLEELRVQWLNDCALSFYQSRDENKTFP